MTHLRVRARALRGDRHVEMASKSQESCGFDAAARAGAIGARAMHAAPTMVKSAKHTPVTQRRDATGHLNPAYEAQLLANSREMAEPKDDDAFLPSAIRRDPLAEELGEGFLRSATGAEDDEEDSLEEVVPEESGGPFVETTGAVEFAHDIDASNPEGATREPFPRTSSR